MQTATELLRAHQLRVTAPRVAVLDVLADRSHLTADEVAIAVRERIGSLSLQAAYHVLDTLVGAGLVRRIEPAGSAARHERRVGDNHHHLICRGCGEVVDIDCHDDPQRCLEPPERHGYDIVEAEVVFWGFCPACRDSASTSDTPRRSS